MIFLSCLLGRHQDDGIDDGIPVFLIFIVPLAFLIIISGEMLVGRGVLPPV
jgi:hypothetical protein